MQNVPLVPEVKRGGRATRISGTPTAPAPEAPNPPGTDDVLDYQSNTRFQQVLGSQRVREPGDVGTQGATGGGSGPRPPAPKPICIAPPRHHPPRICLDPLLDALLLDLAPCEPLARRTADEVRAVERMAHARL